MQPRIARTVTTAKRMPDPNRDRRHSAFICRLGCLFSDENCDGPIDGHHLMRLIGEGPKGGARKHADRWRIPLCHYGHHQFGRHSVHHHGDDEACLAAAGFDGRAIAMFLYAHSGDEETCRNYLQKARDIARLKVRRA